MKVARNNIGTKRPAETNIVSPPRRGPKGRFSFHSSPALNPGFNASPEGFKKHQRISSASDSTKMQLFDEKREEVNVEASSPGSRSGPRCVTFQENHDSDGSPIQSSHRLQRPQFESPRSSVDMHINYVSPSSVNGNDYKPSPRSSLRSNRGGSRAPTRYVELDERCNSSSNTRGSFPVSNRGRGMRNVSTRGRAPKVGSMTLKGEKIEDSPMILKKIEELKNIKATSAVKTNEKS